MSRMDRLERKRRYLFRGGGSWDPGSRATKVAGKLGSVLEYRSVPLAQIRQFEPGVEEVEAALPYVIPELLQFGAVLAGAGQAVLSGTLGEQVGDVLGVGPLRQDVSGPMALVRALI